MRDTTHPAQSSTLTAVTVAACFLFLVVQWSKLGPTSANLFATCVAVIFALVLWLARTATGPAAIVGGLIVATLTIGTVRQPAGGWGRTALPPLIVLLLLTLFATRFRRATKERLGTAESRSGRRASQVCANLGAAAFAAMLCASGMPRFPLLLALSAALVEAAADTVSSEVGQALQGKTILLTTGRVVSPGVDGGISLAGTLAGFAGGAAVSAACALCFDLAVGPAILCWAAGIAGVFFDSWLGATWERKSVLGNDAVNFLSTCCSALLAAGAAAIL
jgi:uncharacterized protein (TIGR00297 family)